MEIKQQKINIGKVGDWRWIWCGRREALAFGGVFFLECFKDKQLPYLEATFEQAEINSFHSCDFQSQEIRASIDSKCGLGASVGCERASEHSTRRDESHIYYLSMPLFPSPKPQRDERFVSFESSPKT